MKSIVKILTLLSVIFSASAQENNTKPWEVTELYKEVPVVETVSRSSLPAPSDAIVHEFISSCD